MADGKRYASHRKDLLPTVLVSKKTKWNGEKPHTQIETPPSFDPWCTLPRASRDSARHVFLVLTASILLLREGEGGGDGWWGWLGDLV